MSYFPPIKALDEVPLVDPSLQLNGVTELVAAPIEAPKPPRAWFIAMAVALALLGVLGFGVTYLVFYGIGAWGNNNTVGWAWDITNFVFWIGIGHAGTLISAVLFLFRQKWRTSINRFAEAMTIFAVVCALMFPTIHVGRIWVIWWCLPLPNQMSMWPNFKSPLLWDVFAVSTYGTVSIIFWYVGLIPDFATMRDRAKTTARRIAYGIVSLGWRGSNRHWQHYERAYLIFAGISTPLVLSVHSVVSFDFATSVLPGWHTTIFPPYFVAGAIFSGFGMVMTLMVLARELFGLDKIVQLRHLENMNKVILLTGSMVGYAYAMEFFIAWYSGNPYERFTFVNRAFGTYAWAYWIMISCNVISPQLFWFKKLRTNVKVMFVVSIFVNIGMWFERFVITVTSLHRDYLPSSWNYFRPTFIDLATLLGSFGLFFVLFLLFLRFIPMIAIAEVKAVLPSADPHHGHDHESDHAEEGAAEGHPVPAELPRLAMSDIKTTTESKERTAGLLAEYDSAAAILHACEKVRDAGYTKWDAHTPFPVHGLDGAMGLKPTPLGWISLTGGITGGSLALLMQWWMNGYDYALNIAGKPAFAVQAFVPVTFELTILLTAFATLFGMLGLNQLPTFYHWVFGGSRFSRVTDDRFFISIAAEDPKFDVDSTRKLLDKTHPTHVEEVKELIESGAALLGENAATTFEALTGVTAPFNKGDAGKVEKAKSEPPPAEKAKSEPPPAAEKAKSEPPPAEKAKSEPPPAEKAKSEPPPAEKAEAKADESSEEKKSDADEKKEES